MVNEFDILGDVYHYLKDSELAKVVTGQVSKTGRKTDKEDICISVLSDVPIRNCRKPLLMSTSMSQTSRMAKVHTLKTQ